MLFANKQALETDLKVELLSIRERELALYTENCQNIASISCMLAGFAYVTLTYENEDTFADQSHYLGRPVYELLAMFGMLCNMASMFGSTVCTMLGPGLALRGGDGAVDQAVEGLALEYRTIFMLFLMGVVSFYACFTIFLVLDYNQGSTLDVCLHGVIILCFLVFLRSTARACKRIYKKFRLPPEHAVAGSFDPDGTQHVASREATELERLSRQKVWYQWPYRQYLHATVFMNEFVGISHSLFEERYKQSTRSGGHSVSSLRRRKANNDSLHKIIKYLERPNSRTGASATLAGINAVTLSEAYGSGGGSSRGDADAAGMSSVHSDAYGNFLGGDDHMVPSGRRYRGGGWLGFGARNRYGARGEERMSLPGSVSQELELSAMTELSPSMYAPEMSGAISPAESADEQIAGGTQAAALPRERDRSIMAQVERLGL